MVAPRLWFGVVVMNRPTTAKGWYALPMWVRLLAFIFAVAAGALLWRWFDQVSVEIANKSGGAIHGVILSHGESRHELGTLPPDESRGVRFIPGDGEETLRIEFVDEDGTKHAKSVAYLSPGHRTRLAFWIDAGGHIRTD